MDDHHVPTWLANVKEAVAELVRDPREMLRFREQVRGWSADVETQKSKPDFAPLKLRFPLPIRQQALTSIEEYATVSAIHDWQTEESEHRIAPWRELSGPECVERREASNYFVLHWQLDGEPLHERERQRVRRAFKHVKEDVQQQIIKPAHPNGKTPARELDGPIRPGWFSA